MGIPNIRYYLSSKHSNLEEAEYLKLLRSGEHLSKSGVPPNKKVPKKCI
jgi:hypothetical protein